MPDIVRGPLQAMTRDAGQEASFDPIDVEAVDWVVRLTVGRLSEADRAAFERWRPTSERHERAFEAASDLCGHLRGIPLPLNRLQPAHAAQPGRPAGTDNIARLPVARLSRRRFLGGGAIAASLAGGLALTRPPLGLWPSLAELMSDERTGAGEQRTFSPTAGVSVELNTRSSASATDGGNGLTLRGEAYVTIAPREEPFQVTAAGGVIAARDAAFNVQALNDGLCVTCVRGMVVAERSGRRAALTPGREIAFAASGLVRETGADETIRLAWRRGLLILRGEPVAKAIPEINRYFPGRIVLTDSSKSGWPITGTFHIRQIGLAVVQLEQLLDVTATRLPGGVVLLG